jgi:hypothetical protein
VPGKSKESVLRDFTPILEKIKAVDPELDFTYYGGTVGGGTPTGDRGG